MWNSPNRTLPILMAMDDCGRAEGAAIGVQAVGKLGRYELLGRAGVLASWPLNTYGMQAGVASIGWHDA